MGYRLHFAKEYKVSWDGGYFGGQELENVLDLLNEFDAVDYQNEYVDEWELNKDAIRNMIAALRKNPRRNNKHFKEDKEQYTDNYTNQELADIFTDMLDNSEPAEDYIKICWF